MAGETVLIVDSNEKTIQQFSEPMRKVGYHMLASQWAEEAINLIHHDKVDVVVVRNKLPGMSCTQFIQTLRKDQRYKIRPVIIVFGKDDLDSKIQAFKSGADDYMVLPFPMPELFFRVDVRLRKTISDDTLDNHEAAEALSIELDIPTTFPTTGSLVSRSLPSVAGNIFNRGLTGALRLIEKQSFRVIYFENGFIRGIKSSRKWEKFSWKILRWKLADDQVKMRLKPLLKTASDAEIASILTKTLNYSPARQHAAAIRFISSLIAPVLKMTKADYDWIENDAPKDVFLSNVPGAHPAHLFLSTFRNLLFKPSYKLFIPKANLWVIPSLKAGRVEDTFRLTPSEFSFLKWMIRGKTIGEILSDGAGLLPYAQQFLHFAICFEAVKLSDKKPPQIKDEETGVHDASAFKPEQITMSESDEFRAIQLEDGEDETRVAPAHPAPISPPVKSEPAAVASSHKPPVKSKPVQTAPVHPPAASPPPIQPSAPPVKASERTERPVEKTERASEKSADRSGARAVRELYPDKPKTQEPELEFVSLLGYGFNQSHLNTGTIASTPLPFLFGLLSDSKKTGILVINADGFIIKLYWKRGRFVFARSDNPKLRIDQILLDMGLITPEQRSKVDEMIAEMGKMRSGTLIFKQQLVNMIQLSDALHHQMELILDVLFTLVDGDYRFVEGDLPEEEHISLDLASENLILDGIRKIQNSEHLSKYLPELSTYYVQSAKTKSNLGQYKLGPVVTAILDKFRHACPVKEAVAGAEVGLKEFKLIILGLFCLGLLQMGRSK